MSELRRMADRLLGMFRYRWRDRQSVFADIYRRRAWGGDDSVSGPGSDNSRTKSIREALPRLIRELSIRRMLDIPCGDLSWISQVDLDLDEYIGADIVPELIDDLNARYSGTGRRFVVADLVSSKLPPTDLLFCRHCLIHLSNQAVLAALQNVALGKFDYFCTSQYRGIAANRDIITGQWRPLNLCLPPFLLPPPSLELPEEATLYQHRRVEQSMAVWTNDSLRDWLHTSGGGRLSPSSSVSTGDSVAGH